MLLILALSHTSQSLRAQVESGESNSTNALPQSVHALKAVGIENFFQLSRRLYSGSAPEGAEAFAALSALGIKTIITVDGAKPDVTTAAKYGLRYVHLPIGYDSVPTNQELRLIKATESLTGPTYIHCHHGSHRGPAAAAVICMGLEGWSASEAEAWLHLAGTSPNYAGLYRSVRNFRPPSQETVRNSPDNFPAIAETSPLVDTMVKLDEHCENLKTFQKAGFTTLTAHPDLIPGQEALLLKELLTELSRSTQAGSRDKEFTKLLLESRLAAESLEQGLKNHASGLDAVMKSVTESCTKCHKRYRN